MKKGFMLIELILVIAIIGILASIVIVAISPSQNHNKPLIYSPSL